MSDVGETVTVEETGGLATETAPSSGSLEERSAKSEINAHFIENFTSPVSDYSDILQMAHCTYDSGQFGGREKKSATTSITCRPISSTSA